MVRTRNARTEGTVTPPDLTQVVADLQHQITEQQQLITTLMGQQGNPVTPPANQNALPVIPTAAPVPPAAPTPMVRQEAYLIQWQRLKPEAFSGNCEPWDAQA